MFNFIFPDVYKSMMTPLLPVIRKAGYVRAGMT